MFTAERRGVRQQLIRDNHIAVSEFGDGTVQIDRVPQDDGGYDQVQPGGAVTLVLQCAVMELPASVEG